MRCTYLKAILLALAVITAPALSHAADSSAIPITGAPAVVVAPAAPNTFIIEQPSPVMPAPVTRYGCSRIWRCDPVICEWRRGCFGIYGYMEGPYYTLPLAKRQYERHGWPVPSEGRANFTLSK